MARWRYVGVRPTQRWKGACEVDNCMFLDGFFVFFFPVMPPVAKGEERGSFAYLPRREDVCWVSERETLKPKLLDAQAARLRWMTVMMEVLMVCAVVVVVVVEAKRRHGFWWW